MTTMTTMNFSSISISSSIMIMIMIIADEINHYDADDERRVVGR